MKIRVFSRPTLSRLLSRKKEKLPDWVSRSDFISINGFTWNDTVGNDGFFNARMPEASPVPEEYHDCTLILHFDDVTLDDDPSWKPMTEDQAKAVLVFLRSAYERGRDLCIHCATGISRSGAVGAFANDYANKYMSENIRDWKWFYIHGCECSVMPNTHVMRLLDRVLWKTMYTDEEFSLGSIDLSDKVRVTDPFYPVESDGACTVKDMIPGKYNAYALISHKGPRDDRVDALYVIHDDYQGKFTLDEINEQVSDNISVDSGLAGIFDLKYWEMRKGEVRDRWCKIMFTEEYPYAMPAKFPVEGKGVVTTSGYGDGVYKCYVCRKDGGVAAVKVSFT